MMKALQIRAPGEAVMIEVPRPRIRSDDEVLVRMKASGICGQHENKIWKDLYLGPQKVKYPGPPGWPGHEGAGEVVETGSEVGALVVGDKVVICGFSGNTHQEYLACPDHWLRRVESSVDWVAAAITEVYGCVLGILSRGQHIQNSTCVTIGLGAAGLAAVEWLRVLGAREIVGIDICKERLTKGLEFGADSAADANDEKSIDRLIKAEPETVIDCSGSHAGFRLALRMATKEALLFGYNDQPFQVVQSEWFHKSLTIRTRHAFDMSVWTQTVTALNRGLMDPGKIVSHTLPFSEVSYAEAMEMVGVPSVTKIAMIFENME